MELATTTKTESCPRPETGGTPSIPAHELRRAFGVDDAQLGARLLSQLANAVQMGGSRGGDPASIEELLALIQGIGPRDTLEAMSATLLAATQHASLEAMRKAIHPDQTPEGRSMYLSLSLKTIRTFTQLYEAFNHGRGKGLSQQRITVEHVTVEAGAQAVVGAVTTRRGE